jgi:hypothetical protein
MKLSVLNTSEFPLVIGPGGVIDQQVVIDTTARGLVEQYFPASAIAKLTGRLVLQPRQSVATIVRVDGPGLAAFLDAHPNLAMSTYASAVFNPRSSREAIFPGPGGFRVQSKGVIDRPAMPLAKDAVRQDLARRLQAAEPIQRLMAIETIAGNVQVLRHGQQKPTEDETKLADNGVAMIQKALTTEQSSAVRAVGQQLLADLQPPESRDDTVKAALESKDWESRVIGCLSMAYQPQAKRKTLLTPLADNDADANVKALAKAILALPEPAPTSQPASAPADAPGNAPGE